MRLQTVSNASGWKREVKKYRRGGVKGGHKPRAGLGCDLWRGAYGLEARGPTACWRGGAALAPLMGRAKFKEDLNARPL